MTNPNEIHVCVECVHYQKDSENGSFDKCQAKFELNLVTGFKTLAFCQVRRDSAQCNDFEKLEVNYG